MENQENIVAEATPVVPPVVEQTEVAQPEVVPEVIENPVAAESQPAPVEAVAEPVVEPVTEPVVETTEPVTEEIPLAPEVVEEVVEDDEDKEVENQLDVYKKQVKQLSKDLEKLQKENQQVKIREAALTASNVEKANPLIQEIVMLDEKALSGDEQSIARINTLLRMYQYKLSQFNKQENRVGSSIIEGQSGGSNIPNFGKPTSTYGNMF